MLYGSTTERCGISHGSSQLRSFDADKSAFSVFRRHILKAFPRTPNPRAIQPSTGFPYVLLRTSSNPPPPLLTHSTLFARKYGTVLRHGSAKALPLKSVESLDSVLAAAAGDTSSGGKDNEHHAPDENDASAANIAPPATPLAIDGKSAGPPPMECEGGVCKLVRKPKINAPATQNAEEKVLATAGPRATPAAAKECEGGVCKLVRKPNKTPQEEEPKQAVAAAEPSATPAVAGRKMDCEGGVCKLVRKPKITSEKEDARQQVAAAAAPAPPAATPASTARTVECQGGVCKLVRKPKKAVQHEGPKDPVPAAAVEKSPLVVGDAMPSLQVRMR